MKTILVDLFFTFFKIGLFTFGGGYAMISIIEDKCVEHKKWITHEDMMNVTVLAESTPGPIAINCATFVGYKKAGFWGAVSATLGVVIPSFVVIYIISMFLDGFLEIEWIAHAFKGIKVGVAILILNAAINMIIKMKKNLLAMIILICSFSTMFVINILSLKFSSIAMMLLAAVFSLMVYVINLPSKEKEGGSK